MSPDERKVNGPLFNTLRDTRRRSDRRAQERIELGERGAERAVRLREDRCDVAGCAVRKPQGTIHPVSQVLDEITAIFADLGFAIAEGPDVEFDDYNFTRLNIPPDHPARQMQDTFYLAKQADGSR